MSHLRENERQSSEGKGLIAAIARRLPDSISPDHLTYIGLAAAAFVAAGFLASHWSNWFLTLVMLGMILNWLSESLVRVVAYRRGAARPLYGYFIDNSADLVAQTLIIMALGFSPYFTIPSALLVLSLYLLLSSYKYLLVVIHGGEQARRFETAGLRLLVIGWSLSAALMGRELAAQRVFSFAALDVIVGGLSLCAFMIFVFIVRRDLARVRLNETSAADHGDNEPSDEAAVLSIIPRLSPARVRTNKKISAG